MPTQFKVEACPEGGGLCLVGDLDSLAAEVLEQQFEMLAEGRSGTLVLDVSRLGYLNSMGIRAFLRLDKLLKAKGASIVFKGTTPSIFRNFRYCGLDSYFMFAEPDLATLQRVPRIPEYC